MLLMETNVNLVSLYDNEFNKLTFEILEKHGERYKLNCCLCFVGTQITSKAHSSYDFFLNVIFNYDIMSLQILILNCNSKKMTMH